jgi:hypothetical protein
MTLSFASLLRHWSSLIEHPFWIGKGANWLDDGRGVWKRGVALLPLDGMPRWSAALDNFSKDDFASINHPNGSKAVQILLDEAQEKKSEISMKLDQGRRTTSLQRRPRCSRTVSGSSSIRKSARYFLIGQICQRLDCLFEKGMPNRVHHVWNSRLRIRNDSQGSSIHRGLHGLNRVGRTNAPVQDRRHR